ncbi:baculoviral IAP repeat-containing protein 3 [Desulfovibrio ferrophilus]|uniref:Baculoviral IAP repeat-containing protein 3 n=1 Tax=Desulfovibrio ferrophilus TaxID=241368 RepID=A0A2Z6AXZ7_9BACT|nr:baculoviral IAP repeat-containing protein 3 [Desulfovibrio ferrophilus]
MDKKYNFTAGYGDGLGETYEDFVIYHNKLDSYALYVGFLMSRADMSQAALLGYGYSPHLFS